MSSNMTSDGEWTTFSLLDLLEFIVDNRGKTVPTADTGIPLIATNCIKNDNLYPVFEKIRYVSRDTYQNWFRAHPKAGDIIFVNKGTPGQVCMVPDPVDFCIAQDMVALRTNEQMVYPKYLFAVLRSRFVQQQIENMHVGTMIPHFKKGDFEKIKIPVPEKGTQLFVGDYYHAISLKIELNNRINKTLEEMAQALFKSWFVDFEFPDENGQPYKSSGGEMEESELGLIPKGWKVESLDSIADYLNGLAMQKYRPEGEEFMPVIKIRELNQGKPDVQSDKASPNIDSKYIVNDGDVLFSWSGSLDVKIWCGGKGGLNQHLFKVTSGRYEKWFYYLWTKYHLEKFRGIAQDKATTMGHIQRKHLAESLVIVPEGIIYAKFNEVMVPLFNLFVNYAVEGEKILTLRDAILPKLMSGEIRVPIEQVAADV